MAPPEHGLVSGLGCSACTCLTCKSEDLQQGKLTQGLMPHICVMLCCVSRHLSAIIQWFPHCCFRAPAEVAGPRQALSSLWQSFCSAISLDPYWTVAVDVQVKTELPTLPATALAVTPAVRAGPLGPHTAPAHAQTAAATEPVTPPRAAAPLVDVPQVRLYQSCSQYCMACCATVPVKDASMHLCIAVRKGSMCCNAVSDDVVSQPDCSHGLSIQCCLCLWGESIHLLFMHCQSAGGDAPAQMIIDDLMFNMQAKAAAQQLLQASGQNLLAAIGILDTVFQGQQQQQQAAAVASASSAHAESASGDESAAYESAIAEATPSESAEESNEDRPEEEQHCSSKDCTALLSATSSRHSSRSFCCR